MTKRRSKKKKGERSTNIPKEKEKSKVVSKLILHEPTQKQNHVHKKKKEKNLNRTNPKRF